MFTKKDLMKLDGLIFLHTINANDSKRKAAESLSVSGDTLSKYIDDLEKELGVVLLSTTSRGSVITPEGQYILHLTEQIHQILRDIETYSINSSRACGTVRVAILEGISAFLMPHGITDFFKKYPEIQVSAASYQNDDTINPNEADIILCYDNPKRSDLVSIYQKDIHYCLVASPEYIKTHGSPKNRRDLLENHLICCKNNHSTLFSGWKDVVSSAQHIIFKTNSILSLLSMIKNGAGISIAPYYNQDNMIPLENVGFSEKLTVHLIVHKTTQDSLKIKVLSEFLRKVIDDFEPYSNIINE